jgi:hypothetical protein
MPEIHATEEGRRLAEHRGRVLAVLQRLGRPSLHDARCAVPDGADMCLHRHPDDDPALVETWL